MERPLSPFMFPTWYRFQIMSVLSILHRLTGIALAVGSILLAWWLVAVAAGGEVFAATHTFIASPIGVLLLFGWSVAFFYHLCSGIRHLAWDAGYGFEIRDAYRSGYAVLAATVVLTVLAWLYVLLAKGGGDGKHALLIECNRAARRKRASARAPRASARSFLWGSISSPRCCGSPHRTK